jgi:hypothetical protein
VPGLVLAPAVEDCRDGQRAQAAINRLHDGSRRANCQEMCLRRKRTSCYEKRWDCVRRVQS